MKEWMKSTHILVAWIKLINFNWLKKKVNYPVYFKLSLKKNPELFPLILAKGNFIESTFQRKFLGIVANCGCDLKIVKFDVEQMHGMGTYV